MLQGELRSPLAQHIYRLSGRKSALPYNRTLPVMDLLTLMERLHREVWVQRAPFTTRSQDGVEVLIDTFSGIMGVPILIRE